MQFVTHERLCYFDIFYFRFFHYFLASFQSILCKHTIIEFICFFSSVVEMAGMGFGMSGAAGNPMGANAMQHLNQFMLQNLQSLIAANPNFLTGGIPNKLLSQMWSEPAKAMAYVSVNLKRFLRSFFLYQENLFRLFSKCHHKKKKNMTMRKWA